MRRLNLSTIAYIALAILPIRYGYSEVTQKNQVAQHLAASSTRASLTTPLPRVDVLFDRGGRLIIDKIPKFTGRFSGKTAGLSSKDNLVFYSIDPELQRYVEQLVRDTRAPHVAIVAMEPQSGRVLAISDKSKSIPQLSLHAGFPAASLFKVITASAALENSPISPNQKIFFRGGTYTLNRYNYDPNPKLDRNSMTLSEALGKSCNPVFSRVALKYLSPPILKKYAERFGFNESIGFEVPHKNSMATIPTNSYELGRTAAGFGEVRISPLHAAALMSGIANGGVLPEPSIIEQIVSPGGSILYERSPGLLKRILRPATAGTLLEMMELTTTIGTSRRAFMRGSTPVLKNIHVAAKTGTLSGNNPKGLNNWFIGAAPLSNPEISVAVIVVDAQVVSAKASELGRRVVEKYLRKVST